MSLEWSVFVFFLRILQVFLILLTNCEIFKAFFESKRKSSSCKNVMSGSASVAINSLPKAFAMTGGGDYYLGGAGVHIGTNGSQVD